MKKSKKRLIYAAAFLLLLAAEILIALFVDDDLIRPYGGDFLVVILLYCLVRIILPDRLRLLPLYIFLFALGVELLQKADIAGLLGLSDSRFFSVLIGGVFDWRDILCYAAGCICLTICEILFKPCKK